MDARDSDSIRRRADEDLIRFDSIRFDSVRGERREGRARLTANARDAADLAAERVLQQ